MAITKFEDFSSELILSVFDYLSPGERYTAFFHSNSRLRFLVKKWTHFSRKSLDLDIQNYSTLHSWYKHLSFTDGGTTFYICPRRESNSRYMREYSPKDPIKLYWYFMTKDHTTLKEIQNETVRNIILRYPIQLTPFFYHDVQESSSIGPDNQKIQRRVFYGGHIILRKYQNVLKEWVQKNYPDHIYGTRSSIAELDWLSFSLNELTPIFDGEWLKSTAAIQHAAEHIWNELKELNDVNPMELFPPSKQ